MDGAKITKQYFLQQVGKLSSLTKFIADAFFSRAKIVKTTKTQISLACLSYSSRGKRKESSRRNVSINSMVAQPSPPGVCRAFSTVLVPRVGHLLSAG
jgi:hypothetical protein